MRRIQTTKTGNLKAEIPSALGDCIKRKKLALIKSLKKKGLKPYEIQLELMEKEPEMMEQCEELKGILQAYQGGSVDVNELLAPDEEEDEEERTLSGPKPVVR